MATTPQELAITHYIDVKNNTIRFPVGTVPDAFYQGIYEYVQRTGKTLTAQAPGKFSREPGLSVLYVPENVFPEKVNSFENCRFFLFELNSTQTLRDIGSVLFELFSHYPHWNCIIRKSNSEEILLSPEDVHFVIKNLLLDPTLSEQDILKKIRESQKKHTTR